MDMFRLGSGLTRVRIRLWLVLGLFRVRVS